MRTSTDYGFKLPEGTDNVKRQDLVDNFESIDSELKNHATSLSDMDYQTAGGTATAITLTMQTLRTGYAKTFIASANNAGVTTTINTKKLYKPATTSSPTLIAGKAYTVWYNAAGDNGNGCFFIKASAEGTALAAHVLKDKTFSNDNDTGLIGTLDLSLLTSENIKAGITINNISGKASLVDTIDATAIAADIVSGKIAYINGVKITGNATIGSLGGKRFAIGTGTSTNGSISINVIPFQPTTVMVTGNGCWICSNHIYYNNYKNTFYQIGGSDDCGGYITTNGFYIQYYGGSNTPYTWYAWE